MGKVESQFLAYLKQRLEEGALSVPESEIMAAIVPADHPEYRFLPAYRYGLQRLRRRSIINAIPDREVTSHYFIGNFASAELRKSLGM